MAEDAKYEWIIRFLLNFISYAKIVFPCFIFVWISKTHRFFSNPESFQGKPKYYFCRICQFFVEGGEQNLNLPIISASKEELRQLRHKNFKKMCGLRPNLVRFGLLAFCSCGLLLSYLAWGILQEKLMTKTYLFATTNLTKISNSLKANEKPLVQYENRHFMDSQFIVFANRIVAFLVALLYISCSALFCCESKVKKSGRTAPFYKFIFASLSNVTSSWCQYEALKFISFPSQVLGKASKIIPTMLMGLLVQRKVYPCKQYLSAFGISLGVGLFLISGDDATLKKTRKFADYPAETTMSGVALMAGYLAMDSFTSNWQSAIFKEYPATTSMQMMCGVNFFSLALTSTGLSDQGDLSNTVRNVLAHSELLRDITLTSLCSAFGQLFIFYTIYQFGAVNFTIIMTVRQALSILFSCLIFGHSVTLAGYLGVLIVFIGLFAHTLHRRRSTST